jgi:hypothetical protein
MVVLAHGRMPQLQQLGFATSTQELLKSSYPDIDAHGPAMLKTNLLCNACLLSVREVTILKCLLNFM